MDHMTNTPEEQEALLALKEVRTLLESLTPLKTNCGKLCGGACCLNDETGNNGMALLPLEHMLYQEPIDDFPFRLLPDDSLVKGGMRLVCEGECVREHRPFQCRIFPLRIHVSGDAADIDIHAEIDPRAWAICPLPEMGGLRALDARFVSAVQEAGERLVQNDRMLAALRHEQAMIDELQQL